MSPILIFFGKQTPLFRPPLDDPDADYCDDDENNTDTRLLRRTTAIGP